VQHHTATLFTGSEFHLQLQVCTELFQRWSASYCKFDLVLRNLQLKDAIIMWIRLITRLMAGLAVIFAVVAVAKTPVSGADKGPAIGGYDVVAYFTDGKPEKGASEHAVEWNGATWLFVSEEHRALFEADPEKYAPQYGGYCAYAAAHGSIAGGSGERWRIVDGKLYLNNNWLAQKLWQNDVPGNIKDSDQKWPAVKAKIEAK